MHLKEVEAKGYYIDLWESLKSLLSNPAVREEIIGKSHVSTDGISCAISVMGTLLRNILHVFRAHPDGLQYHDDIEVCNPLGTSAGVHKLGVFYYTLGNIRPVFRSSLQAIQLLGVAKSSDMNQSARDILLRNFVQCMKLLSTDEGYRLELDSGVVVLHGAVVCLCGDIPASNFLGGFALRKCRQCLCSKEDLKDNFHVGAYTLRDSHSHNHYCQLVESDVNGCLGYSTTYGVNNASILLDIPFFDVTKCLPYDI
ncbi:uncharacterized protein LOC135337642 [Halichondria panicea]|uniref:uncharacterized protein LOC135337642 n=1 Tax=Halichondria panicea TaxID=6063 RepID=UPI00312B8520